MKSSVLKNNQATMKTAASPEPAELGTPKPVTTLTLAFAGGVQLNQCKNAWRPRGKRSSTAQDSQALKTEELLRKVRGILNKLTPEKFEQLTEQVLELTIDTEERISGVAALVFEKAIDEPNFSVMYAQMCHRLAKLKVQMSEKPNSTVSFRTVLLRRCQKEFEGGRTLDEALAKKQAELDAATSDTERQRLNDELEDAKIKARRQSLGCVKLIGELFKGKMLTNAIIHNCLLELLKKGDENSLQCLSTLLTIVGKGFDVGDFKPLMDEIFSQIAKLLTERRVSTRIRFMLQDVVMLRSKFWVPRRAEQGPKTIRQVHQEAAMEEQEEQNKINQQLFSRDSRRSTDNFVAPRYQRKQTRITAPVNKPSRTTTPSRAPHITKQPKLNNGVWLGLQSLLTWTQGCGESRTRTPAMPDLPALPDEITRKKVTVDDFEVSEGKIQQLRRSQETTNEAETKTEGPAMKKKKKKKKEVNNSRFDILAVVTKNLDEIQTKPVPLPPQDHEGWVKVSAKDDPTTEAVAEDDVLDTNDNKQQLDDQMALTPQAQRSYAEACTKRGNTSNDEKPEPVAPIPDTPAVPEKKAKKVTFSLDDVLNTKDDKQKLDVQVAMTPQPQKTSTEVATGSAVKPEPVAPTPDRAALPDERIERKSRAIIEEFLHLNDYKEAMECVQELPLGPQLKIFVRIGVESTLERSPSSRDHMGQLLLQLVQRGILAKAQFYKGFTDILEQADDLAIDIPHFWLYLAQLLSPVLKEGELSMKELFSELSKPLIPVGSAGILISQILHVLCKPLSQQTVASLWRESGISWTDILPKEEDVNTFISQQKLQFIQPDSSAPRDAPSQTIIVPEELIQQLERLLQEDVANNQHILDWIEANVEEPQRSSPTFLRALMTAVCKATVNADKPSYPVDTFIFKKRMPLLHKYLTSDAGQQLQALYALQALSDTLSQPPRLLQMLFDSLYKWKLISSEAFYMWQTSTDPAEQQGKALALKTAKPFLTFLSGFRGDMGTRN